MHIVIQATEEHTEDKNRDKDIEHNRQIDKYWQLNADGHREEEHAILNHQEAYQVGKDSLTQHDENQSRQEGVECHTKEYHIGAIISHIVGYRAAGNKGKY